jgi:hypothetical protein
MARRWRRAGEAIVAAMRALSGPTLALITELEQLVGTRSWLARRQRLDRIATLLEHIARLPDAIARELAAAVEARARVPAR